MPPTRTTRQNGWTLRALRKERGLTVAALAAELDILPQSLSNIELETKSVSTRLLARIARFFGVRPEVLDRDAPPMCDLPEVERDSAQPAQVPA